MQEPELDDLIIEHLADLDRAAARISAIGDNIFSAMTKIAEEWAQQLGWAIDFTNKRPWEGWIAPQDWRTKDTLEKEKKFDAWFDLGVGADDTQEGIEGEDYFYLTRLCGAGVGNMLFRFCIGNIAKQKQIKQYFSTAAQFLEPTPFLSDSNPSFFLPFTVNTRHLAEALRNNDPAAALGPFEAALGELHKAKPAFDNIVSYFRN